MCLGAVAVTAEPPKTPKPGVSDDKSPAAQRLMKPRPRLGPVTIRVPDLVMTGLRFQPVTRAVPDLVMTGLRFQPVNVAVPDLVMTGLRE